MRNSTPPFFPDRVAYPAVPGMANQPTGQPKKRFPRIVMNWLKIPLAAAIGGGRTSGEGDDYKIAGTGFKLMYSEGGQGLAEVKFNDEGMFGPFVQGIGFNPLPFDRIKIRSDAQPGITLWFAYWTEDPSEPLNAR